MSSATPTLTVEAKRALYVKALRERTLKRRREPVSFAQQRLWFVNQLDPLSPAYNLPVAVVTRGALDVRAVERTLDEIVRRHEILRTCFPAHEGEPVQEIAPHRSFVLPVVDLSGLPSAVRETVADRLALEEAQSPFALETGPLMRATLISVDQDHRILLLTLHHIVTDGWSLGILVREFTVLYQSFTQERRSPLPELRVQYCDFARWQKSWLTGDVLERQLGFWRDRLANMPRTELPPDQARTAETPSDSEVYRLTISEPVSAAVRQFAQRERVTLFMLLAAGFSAVLARLCGQDDVGIGTLVANRNVRATEELIGFFANMVVLRTQPRGDLSFREYLRSVQEATLDAQDHQDLPFDLLVDKLGTDRDPLKSPLFQTLFAFQNANTERLSIPGVDVHLKTNLAGTAKLDWEVAVYDTVPALTGDIEYCTAMYSRGSIERFVSCYTTFLANAAARPDAPIREISLLTREQEEALRTRWNGPEVKYPDARVHDQIRDQAERTPDAVAIESDGYALTYQMLDRRASQLARYIRANGARRGDRVAVHLERNVEAVVALLAILKAGCAYVPLDSAYPAERLQFMLEDTRAAMLITCEAFRECLDFQGPQVLVDGEPGVAAQPDGPVTDITDDRDLAYIVYTSGSTGRPKGIMIEHGGMRNHLWAKVDNLRLTSTDVLVECASVSFDISIWQFLAVLLVGGRVRIADADAIVDGSYLLECAERTRITVLETVPSILAAMLDGAPPGLRALRLMISNAEPLSIALCKRWYGKHPSIPLLNLYGPTECSDDVVHYTVPSLVALASTWAPLGWALHNTELYIFDAAGHLAQLGMPGELCIGGAGVGRGYMNRPDLTAEKFVPHPFSSVPGARLYRTGDLVRRSAGGDLEFIQRIDNQVKIRGNRIELGEIEAALNDQPGVNQSVVAARDNGRGEMQLIGYVVPQPGVPLDAGELRETLERRLPRYMSPSTIMVVARLPLNANGKVDRNQLPAPDWRELGEGREYEPPQGPVEEILAGIWERVLDRDRVGRTDNFFELGGHSLLATKVMSRVRSAFRVEVPLRAIFEVPTVAGLATRIDQTPRESGSAALPPMIRVPRNRPVALSFAQQRLWFLDRFMTGTSLYNMPFCLRMQGDLNLEALRASFNWLARRHEVLRTTFPEVEGQPVQHIHEAADVPLPIVDVSGAGFRSLSRQIAIDHTIAPFDLQRGPLFRALLVREADREHLLLLSIHHVIADGWSMDLLIRELGSVYGAYAHRRPVPLEDLPFGYADYAQWQRGWLTGKVLDDLSSYWKTKLAGLEPLSLSPRGPAHAERSHRAERGSQVLTKDLTARLRKFSRHSGATSFMVLLAAFEVLVSRYTGQDDITVGTVIANRNRKELEPIIGFFVNMLPLRTKVRSDLSFRQLVAEVQDTCLQAYARQDLPFEKLVDELKPERDAGRTPLVQVTFTLDDAEPGSAELAGLHTEVLPNQTASARFDLECYVSRVDDQFNIEFLYDVDLFEADWIARFLGDYQRIIAEMVDHPDLKIGEASLVEPCEREQIVREWNRTGEDIDGFRTVLEDFDVQVKRAPDAMAVECGSMQISYETLDKRANRLAKLLQTRGVRTETPVGICMERSIELVVAVLGVLKAGGAYVPLDPGYPKDRLEQIRRGAGIGIVVGLQELRSVWAAADSGVTFVALDAAWPAIDDADERIGASGLDPDNLAYILFTSGTTGAPKGAAITHGGLRNHMQWIQKRFAFSASDKMLQKTPLSFDASVWEFFAPLLTGGVLVMAQPEAHRNPAQLLEDIERHRVTRLQVVPSLLGALLEEPAMARQQSLQTMFCGGEALSGSHCRRLRGMLAATIVNLYGPTETTIDSAYDIYRDDNDSATVPIGRPVANLQMYVLDRGQQVCGIGMPGEVYIGGAGLARGYVNRPDLTAERFVPNPFGAAGSRLYRTGDRARYQADGRVQYLGRVDQQVKIRGYRIELEEIEAVVAEHPAVRQCVAVVRQKQLLAYVSAAGANAAKLDAAELRRWVQQRLPEYMMPALFIELERMPALPNGKMDRKALAAMEVVADGDNQYVAPRNEAERKLAAIWGKLLGHERVGVRDNFFSLGGDSILSIQVVARANQAGVGITARQMFEHQTIAELVGAIEAGSGGASKTLPQEAPAGAVRLTPIQRWFFEQELAHRAHYNQSVMLAAGGGAVESGLLRQAVEEVADWHDALRLRFRHTESGWQQSYAATGAITHTFSHIDVSEMGEWRRGALEAAAAQLQESLDLEHGPLMRAAHIALGGGESRLLLIIHHLVVDGVSWRILLEDLQRIYDGLEAGQPVAKSPRTSSYQAWSERLEQLAQTGAVQQEKEYWLSRNHARVMKIKRDHDGSNTVQSEQTVRGELSEEETRRLLQQAPKAHGAQIQELLLSALADAMGAWNGVGDLLVDVEGHGREPDIVGRELDVTRTVGWFTTQYPVLLRGAGRGGAVQRIQRVKEELRRIPRRGLGYGVLRYLGDGDDGGGLQSQPAAEVQFNYLGQFDQVLGDAGRFREAEEWTGPPQALAQARTHVLSISASVIGARLVVLCRFSSQIHGRRSVQDLCDRLLDSVRGMLDSTTYQEQASTRPFPLAGINQDDLMKIAEQLQRSRSIQ